MCPTAVQIGPTILPCGAFAQGGRQRGRVNFPKRAQPFHKASTQGPDWREFAALQRSGQQSGRQLASIGASVSALPRGGPWPSN